MRITNKTFVVCEQVLFSKKKKKKKKHANIDFVSEAVQPSSKERRSLTIGKLEATTLI